jgi:hypothetical protein
MRFSDALLVEGTSIFSVLCYGVFPINHYEAAFESAKRMPIIKDCKIYKFLDEGWQNGLVLMEFGLKREEDIVETIRSSTIQMFEMGSCKAVSFMYDGAFGSYSDIFSEQLASQTYAFSFSREGLVFNSDPDLLERQEWGLVLRYARGRLEGIS